MAEQTTSTLRTVRIVLWALILAIGVGASLYYVLAPQRSATGAFGGDFVMADLDGETFTRANLEGKPTLMFFGYMFCPDVCPTTLTDTTRWRDQLGLSDDDLRIAFVSVDPERDKPELLRDYLGYFGNVTGLVGTLEQTEVIKTAFGVIAEKVDDESSTEYLVNHTASVFMLNEKAEFVGTIAYQENTETAIAKIQRLLEASAG